MKNIFKMVFLFLICVFLTGCRFMLFGNNYGIELTDYFVSEYDNNVYYLDNDIDGSVIIDGKVIYKQDSYLECIFVNKDSIYISDYLKVLEIDRAGKIVKEYDIKGVTKIIGDDDFVFLLEEYQFSKKSETQNIFMIRDKLVSDLSIELGEDYSKSKKAMNLGTSRSIYEYSYIIKQYGNWLIHKSEYGVDRYMDIIDLKSGQSYGNHSAHSLLYYDNRIVLFIDEFGKDLYINEVDENNDIKNRQVIKEKPLFDLNYRLGKDLIILSNFNGQIENYCSDHKGDMLIQFTDDYTASKLVYETQSGNQIINFDGKLAIVYDGKNNIIYKVNIKTDKNEEIAKTKLDESTKYFFQTLLDKIYIYDLNNKLIDIIDIN